MAGRPDVIRQCVFVFLLAWKRISVKRRWLYMWNPSVARTKLSRLNCDRNVDRVVCYLANRLKSGRMPWENWLSGETTARNSSSFVRCCLPPEPLTDPLSLMTVSDITTVERFLGTVPGADQSNQTIIINIFYLSSNKTKTNFCFWSGYVLWQISVMTMFWKPALHLTAILITPATSVLLLIFNSLIWLLGHIQQIGTGKHKKTMDTLQTKFALWSFTWVTNIC